LGLLASAWLRQITTIRRDINVDENKLNKMSDDITDIKISLAKIEVTLDKNTDSLIERVAAAQGDLYAIRIY